MQASGWSAQPDPVPLCRSRAAAQGPPQSQAHGDRDGHGPGMRPLPLRAGSLEGAPGSTLLPRSGDRNPAHGGSILELLPKRERDNALDLESRVSGQGREVLRPFQDDSDFLYQESARLHLYEHGPVRRFRQRLPGSDILAGPAPGVTVLDTIKKKVVRGDQSKSEQNPTKGADSTGAKPNALLPLSWTDWVARGTMGLGILMLVAGIALGCLRQGGIGRVIAGSRGT